MNEAEAEQVREIFGIFLRQGALMPTLEEMQQRGWRLKSWTTRKGERHTGRSFDRHSLVRLLSNVLYVGEVKYQGQVYRGEQPAIVERGIWRQAHQLLDREERGREGRERNRHGAVLKNRLVCAACGQSMVQGTRPRRVAGMAITFA